jgi:hypothetical protein
MLVEVRNQFDDVVSKRRIRKGFTQPVEFLDLSFPGERVGGHTFESCRARHLLLQEILSGMSRLDSSPACNQTLTIADLTACQLSI